MSSDNTLKVAPVARRHAEYAVLNWHYSQAMPSGKLITYGVWEHSRFIGAVIFGRGANDRMLRPFGLKQSEGCELVRVALTEHDATVSQVVAASLRQLKNSNPGLRIVVSYADPTQGHHGGIYQAGNWLYLGTSEGSREFIIRGRQVHERSVSAMVRRPGGGSRLRPGESRLEWIRRVHDPDARPVKVPGKHRYVMPLDKQMRRVLAKRALPYPAPQDVGAADRD